MRIISYPFPEKQQESCCRQIISICRAGGILIYPTETFYALGGNALVDKAAGRISELKRRSPDKPLPTLIGCRKAVAHLVRSWPDEAEKLAQQFWPGPLTLILEAKPALPEEILSCNRTVAVRWSSHPLINALAGYDDFPLISTSANFCGRPPAAKACELDRKLVAAVDLAVIDKTPKSIDKASTIIDLTVTPPRILRRGAIIPRGYATV